MYFHKQSVFGTDKGSDFVMQIFINYSQCTGFRYIQVFDHLKHKPSASYLDDSFTIFSNKYAVTLNQRLWGYNFVFKCFYVACVGCDIQHHRFTLSYRKPVHRGYGISRVKTFFFKTGLKANSLWAISIDGSERDCFPIRQWLFWSHSVNRN